MATTSCIACLRSSFESSYGTSSFLSSIAPESCLSSHRFVGQQQRGWLERLEQALHEQPCALVGEIGLDRAPKWAETWEQQRKARSRAETFPRHVPDWLTSICGSTLSLGTPLFAFDRLSRVSSSSQRGWVGLQSCTACVHTAPSLSFSPAVVWRCRPY